MGSTVSVRACTAAILLSLAGCSETTLAPATVRLSTGQENDALTRAPTPDRAELWLQTTTSSSLVGAAGLPSSSIAITNTDASPGLAGFEVRALDHTSAVLLRGRSVPLFIYTLAGFDLPLFVGRTGEWARPDNSLMLTYIDPVVALVDAQYLIVAQGAAVAGTEARAAETYDFGAWQALHDQPPLPRAPRSLVALGSTLLVVDDTGAT